LNFVTPSDAELATLRADPIIFEQELDVRPEVAASLERALGFRAGRAYWRTDGGQLFAIELGDFGRGWPSMAIVLAFWDRYEPRPLDDEAIDDALAPFLLWMAEVCDGLDPADVAWTLARTPRARARQAAQNGTG
jgi:hypothetical protein